MSKQALANKPLKPKTSECLVAHQIICIAHDTAKSLFETFISIRKTRNAKGVSTDSEQDILRAMFLFSCSGLDSTIKQLIKDALPVIVLKEKGAQEMLKKFIERKLYKGDEIDKYFVAQILSDPNPHKVLIKSLVDELTSDSMQSVDQILRAAAHFDIPSNKLVHNPKDIRPIFVARNEITHEMDIDFEQRNRNRRQRKSSEMLDMTNVMLGLSYKILHEVDTRLIIN